MPSERAALSESEPTTALSGYAMSSELAALSKHAAPGYATLPERATPSKH